MIRGNISIRVVWDRFPQITANMRDEADRIVAETAHNIEALAKANIQQQGLIDTGALYNSVTAVRQGFAAFVVRVGQHYGIYHELGTRFMPARPFFLPAVESARGPMRAALDRLV